MSDKRLDRLIADIRRLANQLKEIFGPAEIDDEPPIVFRTDGEETKIGTPPDDGHLHNDDQAHEDDQKRWAPTDTSEAATAAMQLKEARRLGDEARELEAKAFPAEPLTGVALRRKVAEVTRERLDLYDSDREPIYRRRTFKPDTDPCDLAFALMAAPERMRKEYDVYLKAKQPYIFRTETHEATMNLEEICRILTTYAEGE